MDGNLPLFNWAQTQQPSAPGAPNGSAAPSGAAAVDPGAPAVADGTAAVSQAVDPSVIVFDVETTGTDRNVDQIIELCVQFGLSPDAPSKTWRFLPDAPISKGAQAVHGISLAELAGCPKFGALADEIEQVFAAATVVIGYNLAFDADMLSAEFGRIGRAPIDLLGKTVVDAFRLWQNCEPRNLQAAHQRFVGNQFAAAHSASADVAATGRVLEGMLANFGLQGKSWAEIAMVCDPARASWIGPSRHLRWEHGEVIVNFGKYSGTPLAQLAAGPDRGFLQWVMAKDFPPHVISLCQAALEHNAAEFTAWAQTHFGMAAPTAAPPFAASSAVPSANPALAVGSAPIAPASAGK